MNGLTECREEQDYNYLEREDGYIPEEIEVTVSMTLSKTITIPTNDLEVEEFHRGNSGSEDTTIFTQKSLEDSVRTYTVTPDQAYQYVPSRSKKEKAIQEDLEDWNIDEFVVIQE